MGLTSNIIIKPHAKVDKIIVAIEIVSKWLLLYKVDKIIVV
jgi:hypothetical protein